MDRKEIVFHNRQRIGDMLMFTCAVRDFKKAYPNVKINVAATARHIFDHNPNIDKTIHPNDDNLVKIGPSKGTNQSNRIDWHFANAYRISMEEKLKCNIPQGESRPDIWLSKEEWNAERIIPDPYWVICTNGEKGWGSKMYPHQRFQEFVSNNPDMKFVHIGTKEDQAPKLEGPNVIDHIGKTQDGKTGIRDLFKLFLNAEGSIGLVSFHMHLSGALYKPAIVIAGAREPVSFTRYQGHAYMNTEGMLSCAETTACWHCAIDACTNLVIGKEKVPKCVDMISVSDLQRAYDKYYEGGRLSKDKPSEKPIRFKNIVDAPLEVKFDASNFNKFSEILGWNAGCIFIGCWEYIYDKIKESKAKTVLEFGAGLSTLLMNDMGLEVITYETKQDWIDKMKKLCPNADVRLWDGKTVPDSLGEFDFSFVDGPANGENREHSIKFAAEHSKHMIIHDAGRPPERMWQDKHVVQFFNGPEKGGRRCHYWVKKEKAEVDDSSENRLGPYQNKTEWPKHIKIVSTARGWGGCARSVTTIMRRLLAEGHKVEFIPFRNNIGSREFKEMLLNDLKDVKITLDYASISQECDVLFVYTDDFVWEFPSEEMQNVFNDLPAKRRVMMINYRLGKIGQVPWTRVGWNKYMFLNSTQEEGLLKLLPDANTKVLPPCTDLDPFLKVCPNYNTNVRLVRHSSQGDTKFQKEDESLIQSILIDQGIEISMMPGPSWLKESEQVKKARRTADPYVVADFLGKGNVFWYSLPEGYMDMGPRVILEAMASGLPVIADNWGGAKDRVTPETGWLCDTKEQHIEVIRSLTPEIIKKKGLAARERALKEFIPEAWIQEILNG